MALRVAAGCADRGAWIHLGFFPRMPRGNWKAKCSTFRHHWPRLGYKLDFPEFLLFLPSAAPLEQERYFYQLVLNSLLSHTLTADFVALGSTRAPPVSLDMCQRSLIQSGVLPIWNYPLGDFGFVQQRFSSLFCWGKLWMILSPGTVHVYSSEHAPPPDITFKRYWLESKLVRNGWFQRPYSEAMQPEPHQHWRCFSHLFISVSPCCARCVPRSVLDVRQCSTQPIRNREAYQAYHFPRSMDSRLWRIALPGQCQTTGRVHRPGGFFNGSLRRKRLHHGGARRGCLAEKGFFMSILYPKFVARKREPVSYIGSATEQIISPVFLHLMLA